VDPGQLGPGLVVAPIDDQQRPQPALGLVVPHQPLGDVGERLERDDVLAIEAEHVGERPLGAREVVEVPVAAAEDDVGGDVIRVLLEAGKENVQRSL
jgi:hypothetical protein